MHIAEQVAAELIALGFATVDGLTFRKSVETGGVFGKGSTIVRIDEGGRWFERVDGWAKVEKDIDLREFEGNAKGAIAALTA